MESILEVKDLSVSFNTYAGEVQALRGINFSVDRGETLAIVGESGSGKSVTVQTIMRLIPMPPGEIKNGEILFDGEDLVKASPERMRELRGGKIGMIFQDPMTSLNPTIKVGKQIMEGILIHKKVTKEEAPKNWNDLLDPKWKGQIVMTDPGTAGTTKYAVGALMASKDYGPEYFRKLKENGTELQSGTTATHNQIAAGAYKVGMCLDYVTENLKTKGSTIEFVYPEKDGISIYSPIALVKGAANMDNGKLLYDFILSKEGQDVLVANNLLSVRKDIKQRDVTIEEIAAHAMNIDLATLAANANKVLDDFDAIFKKK